MDKPIFSSTLNEKKKKKKKRERKIFTTKVHMLGEKKEKTNQYNLYLIW